MFEFIKTIATTRKEVEKASLFLDESHYKELKSILQQFQQFHINKEKLIDFRTSNDIVRGLGIMESNVSSGARSSIIEAQIIRENGHIKARYDELLEEVRKSLQSKLSIGPFVNVIIDGQKNTA